MHLLLITPRRPARRLLAVAVLAGMLAPLLPGTVTAEESPIVFELTYVKGYSTWGPSNAIAQVRFWPQEGVVTLDARNLPHQPPGSTYASWIVNTTSGDALALGTFNTSDAGTASQDVIFSAPLPAGANAILVTLQSAGDPAAFPGPRRAIVGYFSLAGHGQVGVAPASHRHVNPPAHGHGGRLGAPARRKASTARTHRASPAHHTAKHPVVVLLPHTGGGPYPPCRRSAGGHVIKSARRCAPKE